MLLNCYYDKCRHRIVVNTLGFHPRNGSSILPGGTKCNLWPGSLSVRTQGFHPCRRGSIPRRVTKENVWVRHIKSNEPGRYIEVIQ